MGARTRGWALLLATAAACGPVRPRVIPTLTALPEESVERAEYLKRSLAPPPPELRRCGSIRAKKIESSIATVVAVLAGLLSASPNAVVGFGAAFDENQLVESAPHVRNAPEERSKPGCGLQQSGELELVPAGQSKIQ